MTKIHWQFKLGQIIMMGDHLFMVVGRDKQLLRRRTFYRLAPLPLRGIEDVLDSEWVGTNELELRDAQRVHVRMPRQLV